MPAENGKRCRFPDIAAHTTAGLFERRFRRQGRDGFLEGLDADRRRKETRIVAGARAGLRRRLVVLEGGHDAVEASFAGQMAVDIPHRFLAYAHGAGDVGRPRQEIAARVNGLAAGRQVVTIAFEHPVFLDGQAGRAAEFVVYAFANRQNDAVATDELDFAGVDRTPATGRVECAETRLGHFDGFDSAAFANDTVGRSQKEEPHARRRGDRSYSRGSRDFPH
ncbi:MAG: hypothetical protein ABR878_04825 [Roseiarcus sp.]